MGWRKRNHLSEASAELPCFTYIMVYQPGTYLVPAGTRPVPNWFWPSTRPVLGPVLTSTKAGAGPVRTEKMLYMKNRVLNGLISKMHEHDHVMLSRTSSAELVPAQYRPGTGPVPAQYQFGTGRTVFDTTVL